MENKKERKSCLFCNWKDERGDYKKSFVARLILGIIILLSVFYFGFKLGESKQVLKREYYSQGYYSGCPIMKGSYGDKGNDKGNDDYRIMGPWMMRGWDWQNPTSSEK